MMDSKIMTEDDKKVRIQCEGKEGGRKTSNVLKLANQDEGYVKREGGTEDAKSETRL